MIILLFRIHDQTLNIKYYDYYCDIKNILDCSLLLLLLTIDVS